MPRRKPDGDAQIKAPRSRKKKESASICGTPNVDMKLESVGPIGFDPMGAGPIGSVPPSGIPNNMGQHNGVIGANGMLGGASEDLSNQNLSLPGPSVGGMPPFSGHPEYFYHQHGLPAGQLPPPPHGVPMYSGPGSMMHQHQHQPPSHQQNPGLPQQFNVPLDQPMSGGPFMYQPHPGGGGGPLPPQNGLPHCGPQPQSMSNAQPGGAPPHLILRQIQMTNLGPNFPQPPFLEYRLQEMNRRLYTFHTTQYTLPTQDHAQWWEAFSHEFFDDDAKMTISLFDHSDMTNRKYTIGRSLIPRFYRSIFDNGVCELYYVVRTPASERIGPQQWGLCALDCENVLMVTRHDRPIPAEVHTECRLFLEFSPFDEPSGYRIKHWAIELRKTQEYYNLPKDGYMDNSVQEIVKSGITRSGFPQAVLHYLKLCSILEPMQIIMHHSKMNNNTPPRETLQMILFNQHRRMNMPSQQLPPHLNPAGIPLNQSPMSVPSIQSQEDTSGGKKPPRKRQRKNAANNSNNTTVSSPKKKNTASAQATALTATPPPQPLQQQQQQLQQQNIPQQQQPPQMSDGFSQNPGMFNPIMYQDVLVVGEPSMMGCEFGEDDERAISRIENTQYVDPNLATSVGNTASGGPSVMVPAQTLT